MFEVSHPDRQSFTTSESDPANAQMKVVCQDLDQIDTAMMIC